MPSAAQSRQDWLVLLIPFLPSLSPETPQRSVNFQNSAGHPAKDEGFSGSLPGMFCSRLPTNSPCLRRLVAKVIIVADTHISQGLNRPCGAAASKHWPFDSRVRMGVLATGSTRPFPPRDTTNASRPRALMAIMLCVRGRQNTERQETARDARARDPPPTPTMISMLR